MLDPFFSIYAIIITVILLIPFGFCLVYIVMAWRQWSIGTKEKSSFKKEGGKVALLLAIAGILVTVFAWLFLVGLLGRHAIE